MEPRSTPTPPIPGPPPSVPLPPPSRRPFHLDVAAHTDPGLVREDNQDSYLVIPPRSGAPWAVLAVCDGMGGAAGGDVASRTAVDALREVMSAAGALPTRDAVGRTLLHAVEESSRRVFALSRRRRELKGMGTTATACALSGDMLYLAQVGDSRAYLLRQGRLTTLTRDQTLATLMVEQGQLAPEDVETFPLGHVILQALGTAERVEVDLTRVRVARGDVLLVCSDGLFGPVPHEAIRETLANEPDPEIACHLLVEKAIEAGGPDNVTAIVARVTGRSLDAPDGPPVPEKAKLDEDQTLAPERSSARSSGAPRTPGAAAARAGATPSAGDPVEDEEARGMGVIARLAAVFRRRRADKA